RYLQTSYVGLAFYPLFRCLVSDGSFPVPSGPVAHRSVAYCRSLDRKSTASRLFISAAESVPAEPAAPGLVGSAPELSHKRTEPQRSCRACGTTLHELNAPGNNLPIRHVPTTRRYASDRMLDHRARQLPRRD